MHLRTFAEGIFVNVRNCRTLLSHRSSSMSLDAVVRIAIEPIYSAIALVDPTTLSCTKPCRSGPGEIQIMNLKFARCWPVLLLALLTASCGGGGSSAIAPTLVSIAISPLVLRLAPDATEQLTVTGTYNNATTQSLTAASETFKSSNLNVASVSTTGLVTVAANAAVGATATISATDSASGVTTASSALVTVIAPGTGPTANSVAAAQATSINNALCGAFIEPYYWEIGDQNGTLVSGSRGTDSSGNAMLATTKVAVASASKLIYATYVAQLRGSFASLSGPDTNFLHFTSGYTNMGSASESVCPNTLNPDDVNQCLTLTNPQGVSFSARDPTTVGRFYYDSGHIENHASQLTPLGTVAVGSLGKTMTSLLGLNISILFGEPLLAGGAYMNAQDYAIILRRILDGTLVMRDALGTNPVCTQRAAPCNAAFSPIPEAWHYSLGHWVEDDPRTHGDGAFSSPGAFGFYPWIDKKKTYYGIISRAQSPEAGEQHGYASAQCGRLIRGAFMTGVEQTQPLPTN